MKNVRVVGCFLEYNGKFALFHRHEHKPDGNTWGLASGKVEEGEGDDAAMLRELYEETGYSASSDELKYIGTYTFSPDHHKLSFDFVTFRVMLSKPHRVILEETAHQDFKWVTPEEAYAMPNLIFGLHDLLVQIGYIKKPSA